MDTEDSVYRELQQHLDESPAGYPATESGVDIQLLKHLFTPEEARIGKYLSNIQLESAARIHKRVLKSGIQMSPDEMREILERMVHKGTVLAYSEGYPEKRYKNSGVMAGGIVDFQVNRLTDDMIKTFDKYHEEQFARNKPGGGIGIPQLRTVPVVKSFAVPEKYKVGTYDDVRYLIENAPGPFAVANCICRQTRDIKGQSCTHSDIRETCLQIGPDHARQYVEMGIGRYITREEAFEILDRAQEAGFILQPENSLHPEAICCCCGDCCGILSAVKKAPRPADMYASNYYAKIDAELCTGCGTCIERCQLEAVTLTDGIAVIDLDRCIGCGNCVVTCETGACRLYQKEQQFVPPEDKDTMYMNILARKKGRWHMFILRLKMLLGMWV
jgi:electron transport complex protein RnfB